MSIHQVLIIVDLQLQEMGVVQMLQVLANAELEVNSLKTCRLN